ncbi:NHL repeat-containing protein [Mucilaginibacter agri]|uniref:NHL repeat-containing protein n=1 Tax=Mucilaginibacter agri TaxID=2695265 RepID=A0A965ZK40_9SPHI|nr:hypothetical protein [Mucilaginibacter agri]NCD71131.1 hypothetical protein [Mucilaginibacter agri]
MKPSNEKSVGLIFIFLAGLLFQNCKKEQVGPAESTPNSLATSSVNSLPSVSSLYEVSTIYKSSVPPDRICSSSDGTLYFSVPYNNTIYQLTQTGKATLMATLPNDGTGTTDVFGIKAGESGTVYAAMINAGKIVKIDAKKHVSYPPVSIGLNHPYDVAIGPDSTLYIADTENRRIVKLTSNGTATILAGKTGVGGNADGIGANARFNKISSIRYAADGNIWVVDANVTDDFPFVNGSKLRKITPNGTVTTFFKLSDPNASIVDFAPAKRDKKFNVTAPENFFLIKLLRNPDDQFDLQTMISHVSNTGVETAIVPYGNGNTDGPAEQASFNYASGITVKPNGIFIADYGNSAVRVIKPRL